MASTTLVAALHAVEDKLGSGARVADVACGDGRPTILLARAFPRSTFHGFDPRSEPVRAAWEAAAEAGVSERVTFEVARADRFPGGDYDLVRSFGSPHEMADPVGVAARVREALSPDGTWLLVGPRAGESTLRAAAAEAGFTRFRRIAGPPVHLVYEAHP